MISVSDLAQATTELVGQITNIVGHIERNYSSYDFIKARYRRNRLIGRLETILQKLTLLRLSCHTTLYLTAKLAFERGQDSLSELRNLDFESANFNLNGFLESLLEVRDIIDEYKADIINTDYTIYERLEECIKGRIKIVNMLLEHDEKHYSIDKLKSMYTNYEKLITSLNSVKDELARKLKESAAVETVSDPFRRPHSE